MNWIAELPFDRSRRFAGNAHGLLDAIIGGWQLSGLFRVTSGLPFNVFNGFQWPTNWQLGGNAFLVSPVNSGRFKTTDSSGNAVVSVFKNGTDAINAFTNPFPGESGARNQVRGAGFFNVDLGLASAGGCRGLRSRASSCVGSVQYQLEPVRCSRSRRSWTYLQRLAITQVC